MHTLPSLVPSAAPAVGPAPSVATGVGVVFDIDGTLAVSSSVHLDALAATAREVFGIDAVFEMDGERPYLNGELVAGWVDAQCFRLLAAQAGHPLDDRKLAAVVSAYVRSYEAALEDGAHPGVLLPGVAGMLGSLSSAGVLLGLSTGNAAGVARAKLSALGVGHLFSFEDGLGFGGLHPDRSRVARAAVAGLPALSRVLLVGDTVSDMRAAVDAGAQGVGVVTGAASPSELLGAGAAAVIAGADELAGFLGLAGRWFPRHVPGLVSAADLFLDQR